jgi:hypothetical protein
MNDEWIIYLLSYPMYFSLIIGATVDAIRHGSVVASCLATYLLSHDFH